MKNALLNTLAGQTDSAIESMQFHPTRQYIGMSDFFALERVKDLQRMQSQNPYGSENHKWASDEMRRLADTYCDDKGNSCASYFGDY